ncbi:hypothetical protein LOK49_Contig121G00013 [Camellia lanceoleosa]|nr:hypothetical protein LOK49_Contig121G00013 [Camellia lanceoleosa]
MRLHQNIDERREADIYSNQADRINIVNQHKLPILRFLDMSVERGNLYLPMMGLGLCLPLVYLELSEKYMNFVLKEGD